MVKSVAISSYISPQILLLYVDPSVSLALLVYSKQPFVVSFFCSFDVMLPQALAVAFFVWVCDEHSSGANSFGIVASVALANSVVMGILLTYIDVVQSGFELCH